MRAGATALGVVLVLVAGVLVVRGGEGTEDPASAATTDPASVRADAPARVRRALALVDVTPEDLGARVRLAGPRPGVRAEVDTQARVITLHVGAGPAHRLAHDLAHELGHLVDHDRLDDRARASWLTRRGARAGTSWWPVRDGEDTATGAGDFAEVYAACHAASPDFRSRVARAPGDPCAEIDHAVRSRR